MSGVSSQPDVGVLVPAGGAGQRAGAGDLKQFRLIRGVPMLLRAVRPFAQHPAVRHIVIALPPAVLGAPPDWLRDLAGERLALVAGGMTRQQSVRHALDALDPSCSTVLVHDAARPLVTPAEIDAVIREASAGSGAVVGTPVSDTLKRAGPDRSVTETVSRDGLWQARTPQGFPRALLEDAHRAAGDRDYTDDAALVEAAGGRIVLVPGHARNIKVTTPEDFALAEALVPA